MVTQPQTPQAQRAERIYSVATDVSGFDSVREAGQSIGMWDMQPEREQVSDVHSKTYTINVNDPETGHRGPLPDIFVGPDHRVVSHDEAMLDWLDALVSEGVQPLSMALQYSGGVATFIGRMPERMSQLANIDPHYGKIVLRNSINGMTKLGYKFSTVRYLCENLHYYVNDANTGQVAFKHTAKIKHRMSEIVGSQMSEYGLWADQFETDMMTLVETKFSIAQVRELTLEINGHTGDTFKDMALRPQTRLNNEIDKIVGIFEGKGTAGDTSGNIGGTALAAYNAITEARDWYRDGSVATGDSESMAKFRQTQKDRTLDALGISGPGLHSVNDTWKDKAYKATMDFVSRV